MSEKKEPVKKDEKEESTEEKTCFVIMPIADVKEYATGHFRRVYDHIISKASVRAGFAPKVASDVKSANLIFTDILERILNADMVICDLSTRNPNVLYELAIRQCFDLPVVLIKDDETKETFDIQGIRYIEYDKELRIDLVGKAVDELTEAIKETYDKKDKDIFSLVQILGRDKASIKSSDLQPDTLAILDAIKALGNNSGRKGNFEIGQVLEAEKYSIKIIQTRDEFSEVKFSQAVRKLFPTAYNISFSYYEDHYGNSYITISFAIEEEPGLDMFLDRISKLSPSIESYYYPQG
ncbi:hypothetical protein M0L20_13500 [Spirosoma sp. RP8]|uniref:50S ribosomal protein L5 n=1 Tax=Spirosoma liriopis TaxID=2937440 RepID=A0ABT0HLY9_9BACT|nr:hypothetical protein [Spirosoma liriopis]MCK8492877.1 hypothetical protein [Spirosoma liriopis]